MILRLDTNVLWPKPLHVLAEAAERGHHRLRIPAIVHAERLFQLRRALGARFDARHVTTIFEQYASVLAVEPLDVAGAEHLARIMGDRHPTEEAWKLAKARAVGREDGVAPATVDLYLAGLATPEIPFVTNDRGREWKGVPQGAVLSLEAALARLAA